jgi:hypothetical protein
MLMMKTMMLTLFFYIDYDDDAYCIQCSSAPVLMLTLPCLFHNKIARCLLVFALAFDRTGHHEPRSHSSSGYGGLSATAMA